MDKNWEIPGALKSFSVGDGWIVNRLTVGSLSVTRQRKWPSVSDQAIGWVPSNHSALFSKHYQTHILLVKTHKHIIAQWYDIFIRKGMWQSTDDLLGEFGEDDQDKKDILSGAWRMYKWPQGIQIREWTYNPSYVDSDREAERRVFWVGRQVHVLRRTWTSDMGSNQLGFKELAFVNLKIQNMCQGSCWKSTSFKMWLV